MKKIISVIIAVAFVTSVVIVFLSEDSRTKSFHLAFSEISQLKREQGSNLGPITLFYSMLNDANMKVFEAYNLSLNPTSPKFAQELEVHIDKTFVHHKHSLPELLTNISTVGNMALKKMDDVVKIENNLSHALSSRGHAWDENHEDITHTEWYTEIEMYTDSKGNTQSRTVTKSKEVYDYTIHTYTYNRSGGQYTVDMIGSVLNSYPAICLHEHLVSASKSHAENEYTLQKSFSQDSDNKVDYDTTTNIILGFHRRTTYYKNISPLIHSYETLRNRFPPFASAIANSHSVKYRTYSHSDEGPLEYRIYAGYMRKVMNTHQLCAEIVKPIQQVVASALKYLEYVHVYISVVMDSKKGDESELRNTILGTAENWQNANFKGTFLLHNSFRYGWFFLKLLGLIIVFGLPIYLLWRKEIMEGMF